MPLGQRSASLSRRRGDTMTVILDVRYQATCPFCLAPLPAKGVMFHRHLALCDRCYRHSHRVSRRWLNRVERLKMLGHFTSVAGLFFFCPRSDWPADVALHMALGLTELSPVTTHQRSERRAAKPQEVTNA
jgi:hypothetical protein